MDKEKFIEEVFETGTKLIKTMKDYGIENRISTKILDVKSGDEYRIEIKKIKPNFLKRLLN